MVLRDVKKENENTVDINKQTDGETVDDRTFPTVDIYVVKEIAKKAIYWALLTSGRRPRILGIQKQVLGKKKDTFQHCVYGKSSQ